MKTNLKDNSKLLYLVIGNQGSGKTVLAEQLKEAIGKDVEIFDDFSYIGLRPKSQYALMDRVSRARHTGEKTIVNLVHIPKEQFNFKTNPYVTWILTSLSADTYYYLKKHLHLRSKQIKKFAKSYRYSALGLRKTRPYLIMTIKNKRVQYEILRFKHKQQNPKSVSHD